MQLLTQSTEKVAVSESRDEKMACLGLFVSKPVYIGTDTSELCHKSMEVTSSWIAGSQFSHPKSALDTTKRQAETPRSPSKQHHASMYFADPSRFPVTSVGATTPSFERSFMARECSCHPITSKIAGGLVKLTQSV